MKLDCSKCAWTTDAAACRICKALQDEEERTENRNALKQAEEILANSQGEAEIL